MASVLLVEDDPVVRAAITRALTGQGHMVHGVALAIEALREVTANNYDAATDAATTLSRTCKKCHTFYKKE